jgi:hypothetical protein
MCVIVAAEVEDGIAGPNATVPPGRQQSRSVTKRRGAFANGSAF